MLSDFLKHRLVLFHFTFLESAKLHGLRAKNVPCVLACLACQRCLRCQSILRAYVLTCECTLCAYVLTWQHAFGVYVLTCQRALCACVLLGKSWGKCDDDDDDDDDDIGIEVMFRHFLSCFFSFTSFNTTTLTLFVKTILI